MSQRWLSSDWEDECEACHQQAEPWISVPNEPRPRSQACHGHVIVINARH